MEAKQVMKDAFPEIAALDDIGLMMGALSTEAGRLRSCPDVLKMDLVECFAGRAAISQAGWLPRSCLTSGLSEETRISCGAIHRLIISVVPTMSRLQRAPQPINWLNAGGERIRGGSVIS